MMIVRHRRPSLWGLVNKEGDKSKIEKIINDLVKKDYKIIFFPSGSAAIFMALWIAKQYKKDLLVPNMGGWKGFLDFPKTLGLKTKIFETHLGIVDVENLEKDLQKDSSLIITSLAGYLSPQPLKEIKKICEEKNSLFIEDISGKIGGDCGYGDIIVCSTGSPKIVNCEYGGFLGLSREVEEMVKGDENFKLLSKTYKTINYFGLLKEELLNAKKVYKKYVDVNKKIKNELENAYFKDLEGISIFLECENPKCVSRKINEEIKLDNGKSITTLCPTYERILKSGITFETKKIDVSDLTDDTVDEIISILSSIC